MVVYISVQLIDMRQTTPKSEDQNAGMCCVVYRGAQRGCCSQLLCCWHSFFLLTGLTWPNSPIHSRHSEGNKKKTKSPKNGKIKKKKKKKKKKKYLKNWEENDWRRKRYKKAKRNKNKHGLHRNALSIDAAILTPERNEFEMWSWKKCFLFSFFSFFILTFLSDVSSFILNSQTPKLPEESLRARFHSTASLVA